MDTFVDLAKQLVRKIIRHNKVTGKQASLLANFFQMRDAIKSGPFELSNNTSTLFVPIVS